MKAIVTGGAGFIGSHLVEALISHGAEVHVIDNLSTGKSSYLPEGVTLHLLDIRSEEAKQLIQSERPDIVFHQAAQVDVQRSVSDPGYDASVNIAGTANIVHACSLASVKKIIYASSCAVYGDLNTALIHEEDPANPISFYGISKLIPEYYLHIFHKLYGLPYTILRYANVYGPRQTPKGEGGVVAIFLDRISKAMPLTIFGDGEQTRDFVYVKDVVAANIAAINQGDQQIVQIGTASSTSVNQLVQLFSHLHGGEIKTIYHQERAGDIKISCLNHTKAYEQLNWKPHYNLHQGLKETYEYVVTS